MWPILAMAIAHWPVAVLLLASTGPDYAMYTVLLHLCQPKLLRIPPAPAYTPSSCVYPQLLRIPPAPAYTPSSALHLESELYPKQHPNYSHIPSYSHPSSTLTIVTSLAIATQAAP